MQRDDRAPVIVAKDVVVPIRNQIAERTTGIAERDPAIHAARALRCELLLDDWQLELAIVLHAFAHRAFGGVESLVL